MKQFHRRKAKIKKPKTFQYSVRRYKNSIKKESKFYNKIIRQIALSIVIILLIIIIKHMNLPLTNKTSKLIKTSIQREVDIKRSAIEMINFAKKAPEISAKAIDVFANFDRKKNGEKDFVSPIESGNIVSDYGENTDPILNRKTFQRGIDILVGERQYVRAIKKGQIVEVQESKNLGKYIKLKHDQNTFSIYGNCSEILIKKGQQVKQGERIALIYPDSENKVSYLHFELWLEGKIVDPTNYIQFDKKAL